MKSIKIIFPLLLALGLLSSCTGTRMLDTWANESYQPQEQAEKIAVLTLHPRLDVRKAQQAYLIEVLEKEGYATVGGLELFSPEFEPTAANLPQVQQKLLAEGVDRVLTVSLLDTERSEVYMPGQVNSVPRMFFNPFGGYFFQTWQQVYQPGYYREDVDVILETKLFDAETGQLIWTGQSSTPQVSNTKAFAKDVARGLLQALNQDRVL